jgi:dCTP deaminase
MSLLCDTDILHEMKEGNIKISPFNENNLQSCSYDVTLGEYYYKEKSQTGICNIWNKEDVINHWKLEKASLNSNFSPDDQIILLSPGERILAHTQEFIGGLNNVTTMMKARSSMGRNGISVCLCAGFGDIGYINRYTMEITNHSRFATIPLVVGKRIAQILFFKTNTPQKTYISKYQSTQDLDKLIEIWKPEDMLPKLYLDR